MTTFDDPTRAFMAKLGVDHNAPRPHHDERRRKEPSVKEYLKDAKTLLKIVKNPTSATPKAALKTLINVAFPKEAGLTPLGLFGLMNEHYGRDWWDWEPETMRQVLAGEHAVAPTREIMNMIGALQLIASTNSPFEHWDKFEKVGHALYGNIVDFRVVQPLEPDELAVTFKYLQALRPGQEFEHEIFVYAAGCCNEAGMVYMPPDLFPPPCQDQLADHNVDKALETAVERLWESRGATDDIAESYQMDILKEIAEVLSHA